MLFINYYFTLSSYEHIFSLSYLIFNAHHYAKDNNYRMMIMQMDKNEITRDQKRELRFFI